MRKFFSVIVLTLLAACATNPYGASQPPSFTKYPAINVDVAKIDVVEEYKSPMRAPNIEHLMAYTPADVMKIWVRDRLHATGGSKLMQVRIIDASVTSTDLPKTKGLRGAITNDQDKRYDARLEVELRIYGEGALSEANTSITITRNVTVPEDASAATRRGTYEKLVGDMMDMLNDKLEKNMQQYMGNYIITYSNQ